MSFAGHVLDSINRIKYNRAIKEIHKAQYQKIKEAFSDVSTRYHIFKDRNQLRPEELKIYKQKIRKKITRDRQKAFFVSFLLTILLVGLIGYLSVLLLNYLPSSF